MTSTYALTVAYRGDAYAGWQRQTNALAVQQVLEEALSGLLADAGFAVPPEGFRVEGAGRTDAGVHARGQVASLRLPGPFPERGLVGGTNARLPADVRVMAAFLMAERPPDHALDLSTHGERPLARPLPARPFHARRDARSKRYRYRLVRTRILSPLDEPQAVAVEPEVDLDALRRAAGHLPGRHDFSAFALAGGAHKSPVRRVLSAEWEERGAELDFVIEGEGFLRGMVRSLVGTLVEVGTGRRSPDDLPRLLTGRPRSEAGPNAPARGLSLERVFYPPPWEEAGGPT